ncbi:MAG: PAS domain-containing protein, partial [Thiomicrorhabdus sp.]|nr:PAS domain-containing protein [Thiomicrorhabdus sp.]
MDKQQLETSFDDQAWISVLQAVEDSYVQSLNYQAEIETKNAALDQAHQFISGVVSAMSDVLIVTDDALSISQVNTAFLNMTHYEESEVIGKPIENFVTIPSKEFSNGFVEQRLYQDVLVDLQGRYNTTRLTMSCSCAQVCSSSFKGRVLVGRPVSEVLLAHEALQKAYKELAVTQEKMLQTEKMASLGRLVAGVAHELNTPISVLQGNLWLLQNNLHADMQSLIEQSANVDEQVVEMVNDLPSLLEDSQEAAKQINRIVKELKQFSYQDALEQQPFNLSRLIEVSSDWSIGNVLNAQIQFTLDVEDALYVVGSSSKFQQ